MYSAKIDTTGKAVDFSLESPPPAGFVAVELCDYHRLKSGAVWVAGLVLDPPAEVEEVADLEAAAAGATTLTPEEDRANIRAALEHDLGFALATAADLQAQIEAIDAVKA